MKKRVSDSSGKRKRARVVSSVLDARLYLHPQCVVKAQVTSVRKEKKRARGVDLRKVILDAEDLLGSEVVGKSFE